MLFQDNGEKLNKVIGDNLFPEVQHISDVKQVLEVMRQNAQDLQEWQVKGILLLQHLGENKYLHSDVNPYSEIIKFIVEDAKVKVADPKYYLDTIESLIPKPPKPIVMAEKERGKK